MGRLRTTEYRGKLNPYSKIGAARHELEQHFLGFLPQPVVELDDRIRYEKDEEYRQYLYFFSDNNALLRRAVCG